MPDFAMSQRHRLPVSIRLRRAAAGLVIAGYLAATGWFFLQHLRGDMGGYPTGYFFTWDMFPGFYTESSRRIAIGRTRSGKHVRLHPSPYSQYRDGVSRLRGHEADDPTRVDRDRSGNSFRPVVEQTLAVTADQSAADPIEHVYLFEQYWPAKYNVPGNSQTWRRRYWRIREEFSTTSAGEKGADDPALIPGDRP